MNRLNYKISTFFLGQVLVAGLLCSVCMFLQSTNLGKDYSSWIGILSIVCLIWAGITLKRVNKTWFSLVFMFEISYCVLTLGQSILTGLGVEYNTVNQYMRENAADVNRAYVFNILCFIALHVGILFRLSKNRKPPEKEKEKADYLPTMRLLGWIVFAVSLVPFLYEFYQLITAYSSMGYAAAYDSMSGSTSWSKVFSLVADFFPPSIFMLLISYQEKQVPKYILAAIILLVSFANLAIGNRSEPICYIVALLWVFVKYANTKTAKRGTTIIAVITLLLIVLVIPIIGQTRNTGELNVQTVVEGVTGEGSVLNGITATVEGMGYSVFPTIKTMQLIPASYPFHYGQSYFYAVLGIFPNVLGGTHVSVQYAALAQWLMKALHMKYGPGFSMPAEAYYNFGWYGALIMPFFGYILATILDERNVLGRPLRMFVLVAGFVVLFSIPRRDTMTAIRNMVYYVGVMYVAVKLMYRATERKRKPVRSLPEKGT